MTILRDFMPVTRSRPCPICGRIKFCLVDRDNPTDPSRVICTKAESATKWGEAGFLHVRRDDGRRFHRALTRPPEHFPTRIPELESLHAYAQSQLSEKLLRTISARLCVSPEGLARLEMGSLGPVDLEAHGFGGLGTVATFPMRGPEGGVVGLRLRAIDGRKLAIPGSRNGIFIPNGMVSPIVLLLICEGESDTAALLDLGYDVVGRPGCTSSGQLLARLVRRLRVQTVVVVADRDDDGRRGGLALAKQLRACCSIVRMVEPPEGIKDARAWRIAGATRREVDAVISAAPRIHIPVDEQPSSEVSAMTGSATGRPPALGDVVTVMGQDGVGEVLEINNERAKVRLVRRTTGKSTTQFFPLKALVVLRANSSKSSIKIYSYGELAALPPTPPLIEDVLRLGDFAGLYGAPSAGKTFIALGMGLCVASGRDWYGHHVLRGPVLYIAGEGVRGLHKRIRAWLQGQSDDVRALVEENFHVIPRAVNFLGDEFEHLLAALNSLDSKPVLVGIDTLARCCAGGDENSAQDMGRFVDACSEVTKLTGATALVLHHTNKVGEAERGSSALRGAADVMLVATADERDGDKLVRLVGDKAKDDDEFEMLTFALHVVEVGTEPNGTPETSCRLSLTTSTDGPATYHNLHPSELQILRTLRDDFFEDGAAAGALMSASTVPKSSFFRHLKPLVKAGYVERKRVGVSTRYVLTPKFDESTASWVSPSPETSQGHDPTESSPVSPVSPPKGVRQVRLETDDLDFGSSASEGGCRA